MKITIRYETWGPILHDEKISQGYVGSFDVTINHYRKQIVLTDGMEQWIQLSYEDLRNLLDMFNQVNEVKLIGE